MMNGQIGPKELEIGIHTQLETRWHCVKWLVAGNEEDKINQLS